MFIKANVSQEDKLEDIQKKNKDKKKLIDQVLEWI